MHGAIDSSVASVPSSIKPGSLQNPNITTVLCSEALAIQGNEPSQVPSDCLLDSVVSCATAISVTNDVRWAGLHPMFRPDQLVLVCSAGTSKDAPTNKGPHEVAKVLGQYTFRLCNG